MNVGIGGVMKAQMNGYTAATQGLLHADEKYTSVVKDLGFPVAWMTGSIFSLTPYIMHGLIGVALGLIFKGYLIPFCSSSD